jgi:hypothetical protein
MKSEDERKALPDDPFENLAQLPSLEELNRVALELYKERTCAICLHCGRSFKDSIQLEKHQNQCTSTKPLARQASYSKILPSPSQEFHRQGSNSKILYSPSQEFRRQGSKILYSPSQEFSKISIPSQAQFIVPSEFSHAKHKHATLVYRT